MKEKIKNILTCKKLWSSILELLCCVFLFCIGYFSGFANGLLIEDDIRDNMIIEVNDLINDNHKNEKIKIDFDKKNAYISGDFYYDTISFSVHNNVGDSTVSQYNPFMNFNYNFILNYSISNLTENSFDITFYDTLFYFTLQEFPTSEYLYYYGDVLSDLINNEVDFGNIVAFTNSSDIIYSRFNYFSSSTTTINLTNDNINLLIGTDFEIDVYTQFFIIVNNQVVVNSIVTDLFNRICLVPLLLAEGTTDFTFNFIEGLSLFHYERFSFNNIKTLFNSGGASEEDLQNAYNDGYNEGKIDGYNERKNSVEDSEQTINSIWSILEKAITSVLNVLSFEILPGIPLYVCIAVPILLCILLWVIKVGAS